MRILKTILLTLHCSLLISLIAISQVRTGAECTGKYFPLLKNKSIGVVANPASLVGKRNLVDTLLAAGISVSKIFCPEHGFRNFEEAGQSLKNGQDSLTGLPIISLYGKKKKPEPADLKSIDLVLFDLQDVGVRFFTYTSTLAYVMEACAENNVPLIVLDRPDPNGFYIDGPVLQPDCASFVGLFPVPVVYGMTIGEFAKMVNEEGWLKNGVICDLEVIPLQNYDHTTRYKLPVNPSPNLQNMNAVYLYPSLCLFEGTIVSVGRGTDFPFQAYGHPAYPQSGFSFLPMPVKGASLNPPYKGEKCFGVDLRKRDKEMTADNGKLNLSWLTDAFHQMKNDPKFFTDFFDLLAGNHELRSQIINGVPENEIRMSWVPELDVFKKIRKKYLIYADF